MFGRHSQASQLRTYSKEPEGPPKVPLVEAQPGEGQEIGADDFTGPSTRTSGEITGQSASRIFHKNLRFTCWESMRVLESHPEHVFFFLFSAPV